jgi:hypothetical protein
MTLRDEAPGVEMTNQTPAGSWTTRRSCRPDSELHALLPADRDIEVTSESWTALTPTVLRSENRLHTIKALMALTMATRCEEKRKNVIPFPLLQAHYIQKGPEIFFRSFSVAW